MLTYSYLNVFISVCKNTFSPRSLARRFKQFLSLRLYEMKNETNTHILWSKKHLTSTSRGASSSSAKMFGGRWASGFIQSLNHEPLEESSTLSIEDDSSHSSSLTATLDVEEEEEEEDIVDEPWNIKKRHLENKMNNW